MNNPGGRYYYGGVAQDYTKAREWYEKAAASHPTSACFTKTSGRVAQDSGKARE